MNAPPSPLVLPVIQARMSSARFPGKVLAPFRGRPLIAHVIDAVAHVFPLAQVIVATSTAADDDPLAMYCVAHGVRVHRGSLDDVFARFRSCLVAHPADWVLRISGDSPLLHPGVIRAVAEPAHRTDIDLVTTIFPRTFPKGQNAELVRAATFLAIDERELTATDREHVTQVYYRHADRFRLLSLRSREPWSGEEGMVVDTLDDLRRLERLTDADVAAVTDTFWPTFAVPVVPC